ncbi:MAG: hypothetical protein KatS3mg103_1389 [Phycisphaerales bacterium]|nr:MAG: hypothetical protein KatS3mg103_1389 [Phycisphaerales bacterium]
MPACRCTTDSSRDRPTTGSPSTCRWKHSAACAAATWIGWCPACCPSGSRRCCAPCPGPSGGPSTRPRWPGTLSMGWTSWARWPIGRRWPTCSPSGSPRRPGLPSMPGRWPKPRARAHQAQHPRAGRARQDAGREPRPGGAQVAPLGQAARCAASRRHPLAPAPGHHPLGLRPPARAGAHPASGHRGGGLPRPGGRGRLGPHGGARPGLGRRGGQPPGRAPPHDAPRPPDAADAGGASAGDGRHAGHLRGAGRAGAPARGPAGPGRRAGLPRGSPPAANQRGHGPGHRAGPGQPG